MGHHGDQPIDPEMQKAFDRLTDKPDETEILKRKVRLEELVGSVADFRGALGEFPEGKIDPEDEGAIQFGITVKDGKVVLDFGKRVLWVGMTPQQAADLASTLLARAKEAGRKTGETVTLVLGK